MPRRIRKVSCGCVTLIFCSIIAGVFSSIFGANFGYKAFGFSIVIVSLISAFAWSYGDREERGLIGCREDMLLFGFFAFLVVTVPLSIILLVFSDLGISFSIGLAVFIGGLVGIVVWEAFEANKDDYETDYARLHPSKRKEMLERRERITLKYRETHPLSPENIASAAENSGDSAEKDERKRDDWLL